MPTKGTWHEITFMAVAFLFAFTFAITGIGFASTNAPSTNAAVKPEFKAEARLLKEFSNLSWTQRTFETNGWSKTHAGFSISGKPTVCWSRKDAIGLETEFQFIDDKIIKARYEVETYLVHNPLSDTDFANLHRRVVRAVGKDGKRSTRSSPGEIGSSIRWEVIGAGKIYNISLFHIAETTPEPKVNRWLEIDIDRGGASNSMTAPPADARKSQRAR